MIRTVCDKCGYDGTYYKPRFHYSRVRGADGKFHRCNGSWVQKEIFTTDEKLRQFKEWLETYPILPAPIDRGHVEKKFLELFFPEEKSKGEHE